MRPRSALRRRQDVDERHHRQDTRPAFVPGTVWGTASMRNCQVELGAVLALNSGRLSGRRPPRSGDRLRPNQPPGHLRHPRSPQAGRFVHLPRKASGKGSTPSLRGFTPPATPAEIYASLLDEGVYHCSIRTMYRLLGQNGEIRERRKQLRHPAYQKPDCWPKAPTKYGPGTSRS